MRILWGARLTYHEVFTAEKDHGAAHRDLRNANDNVQGNPSFYPGFFSYARRCETAGYHTTPQPRKRYLSLSLSLFLSSWNMCFRDNRPFLSLPDTNANAFPLHAPPPHRERPATPYPAPPEHAVPINSAVSPPFPRAASPPFPRVLFPPTHGAARDDAQRVDA